MNKKVDLLEKIVFEYLERRKIHFKDRWLNRKNIWNRFLSPSLHQSKPYIKTRIEDFNFIYSFIEWLENYIKENGISSRDLKEFLIILENHNKRIVYRFQYLLIFGAFLLITIALFDLANMPTIFKVLIFIFALFGLNERAFLIDKQAAIDELKNILEYFIECKNDR